MRLSAGCHQESGAAGGSGPASKAPSTPTEKEPLQEKDMATGPPSPTVLTPGTTVTSETPAASTNKELPQPTVTRPLSPYSAYEDLKPPTSPSPTPSSTANVAKASDVDATIIPSKPADSSAHINLSGPTSATFEEEVFQIKVETMPLQTTTPLSPYAVYDDLKPPTSPSPNAPSVTPPSPSPNASSVTPPPPSYMDGSSKMAAATIPAADKSTDEQNHAKPKLRPLSPFVMYEDLKPPASPMPSPKKY